MSLTSNFDKLYKRHEKKPEKQEGQTDALTNYETEGSVRNLCFVQQDGKRIFLNYAYLVSGEYDPEASIITLTYTTHVVTLRGYSLEGLYENLMNQICKNIGCVDSRYLVDNEKEKTNTLVFEINIKKF